ncbi:MAG TPA: ubiquinol-cytochrome C chaperone family protein [Sphingomicrobium sp.]|nr:ubiquinol-cytochrome C chaperone family protein [Sphingomicrobium sp.]
MLASLFRSLTAPPPAPPLFDTATAIARRPSWYREGQVPDTIDGRFAVLASVLALILVRLEDEGAGGNALSVAVTERFIAVMESEHRELGLGDPTLGKTVRKLVGSLARRTALWRAVVGGAGSWTDATANSFKLTEQKAVQANAAEAEALWSALRQSSLSDLEQGVIR